MSDIRQLLEAAKADPPPPAESVDEILRAGRRRLRRSRAKAVSGAGLGVVAVATALLVATAGGPTGTPASLDVAGVGPTTEPFSLTFAGYAVGAFTVTDPMLVTPGYQQALVRTEIDPGGGLTTVDAGELTVYNPGVFRPDRFTEASTPIEVGGRPGFATMLDREFTFGERGTRRATVRKTVALPAVAWQYADGAWATLESINLDNRGLPADDVRRLAEAFTVGAARPATTPVRVGHMPAGWELASVGRSLVSGATDVSEAIWVRTGTRFDSLTAPVDLYATGLPTVAVRVSVVETEGPYAHPVKPPCPSGQHFCDRPIDARFYAEVEDRSGALSGAEVAAITDGLEFANVDQPRTWFPVPA
ncbi:hypothetical protein [Asanoa iriomotensis]|uniref:DUF4179 domain-containing protein n=1 Tax=Asanoa iriomotensis TaxID=234613 RepID=A0ABQ4BWD3_9ACTN|nr:hypothetical protein [Asanoa iriomotensis]GIF54446.1 hypothetical protein Air01nite_05410 [Asanoa iriomotensis]